MMRYMLSSKENKFRFYSNKKSIGFLGLFFYIAASGPQIGTRVRPVERKGVDLVIVLDTSKVWMLTMYSIRLSKAKLELNKLIKT